MLIEYLGAVTNGLFSREGVQMPPNGIYLTSNFFSRPVRSPLKQQMFDVMGNAVGFLSLAPGADLQPYSQGNGPHVRHFFGKDSKPIIQYFFLDVIHEVDILL